LVVVDPWKNFMPELPEPLLRALEEERDTLNERFRQRQRGGQRIDGSAFLAHVEQAIAPLVMQVHACLPERTRGAVVQLYEASLDLFAASQLGPSASSPLVHRTWKELLPHVSPRVLALHPQQAAGCLSNAVVQIAAQTGARAGEWIDLMGRAAPQCGTLSELLDAGKVAAWLAGMVQYRQAALEIAGRLPTKVACALLGLEPNLSAERLAEILIRLKGNVWLKARAAAGQQEDAAIRCVGMPGAFTGFGGLFARPPIVTLQGERLLASDRQSTWELRADAYGAWFRRVNEGPPALRPATSSKEVAIDRRGALRWGTQSLLAPELANPTSIACDGQTTAVTIATSHHVFLYSRLGPLT
jgi:hypothetical protein